MTTKSHAETELDLIFGSDEMDQMMKANVLELIEVFSKQGHSGFSAPYCVDIFEKVALHKTLSPLTGNDNEWMDVSEYLTDNGSTEKVYQNKRLSSVFKTVTNGKSFCYDIDSLVRYDISDSGYKIYYTRGSDRRKGIKFPYTQKIKYKFSWSVENIFNLLKSKFSKWTN